MWQNQLTKGDLPPARCQQRILLLLLILTVIPYSNCFRNCRSPAIAWVLRGDEVNKRLFAENVFSSAVGFDTLTHSVAAAVRKQCALEQE
jgi:hypothetical protein